MVAGMYCRMRSSNAAGSAPLPPPLLLVLPLPPAPRVPLNATLLLLLLLGLPTPLAVLLWRRTPEVVPLAPCSLIGLLRPPLRVLWLLECAFRLAMLWTRRVPRRPVRDSFTTTKPSSLTRSMSHTPSMESGEAHPIETQRKARVKKGGLL